MLKERIKYIDYNDIEREEDFYFNLTSAEVTEMELSTTGGLVEKINKIVQAQDGAEIIKLFKELIFKAYGEKSPDGRRFVKSEELSKAFSETPAYSILYMRLSTSADEAGKFINGIVPKEL
jgi:hypothetical protein